MLRNVFGLDQKQFGEKIGLSQPTVSGYEKGTAPVPKRTIRIIEQTFGVNRGWLATGEGEMFGGVKPEDKLHMEYAPSSFLAEMRPDDDRLERIETKVAKLEGVVDFLAKLLKRDPDIEK